MMAEKTNWELCVLCHKQTPEELVCPLANPVALRREEAYRDIINLASQFKEFDAAPHPDVELPDEESMQTNRASWHKACRQLYKVSALERAKGRYSQGLPPGSKMPRRTSADINRNLCLFCGNQTKTKIFIPET